MCVISEHLAFQEWQSTVQVCLFTIDMWMTLEDIVLAGLLLCPRSERRLGEAALQWVVNIPFHIANNINIVVIINIVVMSSSLPLPSPFKTISNTCMGLLQHSKLLSRNNYVHFLKLSIHHEGGKDDWSEILVVCADIRCCSGNAQVQPSRGGGWSPGTQGYCQPWPGINKYEPVRRSHQHGN